MRLGDEEGYDFASRPFFSSEHWERKRCDDHVEKSKSNKSRLCSRLCGTIGVSGTFLTMREVENGGSLVAGANVLQAIASTSTSSHLCYYHVGLSRVREYYH